MQKTLIYDLPTRLFHWLFATSFVTAFAIGKIVDDDSSTFPYHMLAGIVLTLLIAFRILWGFVGTRHARFSDFALRPLELLDYSKGILTNTKRRWAGHNPASSWVAIAMILSSLGLALTGVLMVTKEHNELFEELHELFGNGFVIMVILHITGVVVHTLRHKDPIGLSMVTGEKIGVPSHEGIRKTHKGVSAVLVSIVVAFSIYLVRNYDADSQSLRFFGTTLHLGEPENGH